MLKYFSITVVLIFYSGFVFSQHNQVLPESIPEVGKLMPDFVLNDVRHYKSSKVSLQDFKGKWLFLDFWFTGCTVCIKSFPKTNQAQEQLGDDAQFLLVGVNGTEKFAGKGIVELFEKLRAKQNLKLPIAYDSALAIRWNIYSMPHIIGIDPSGIVRVISDGRDMTEDKIRLLMQNKDVSFFPESGSRPDFNPLNTDDSIHLLYSSVLYKSAGEKQWVPDVDYYIQYEKKPGFKASMVPLEALYKLAYFGRWTWLRRDSIYNIIYPRCLLEISDTSLFDCDFTKGTGLFNYELIVPRSKNNMGYVMKRMQSDLNNTFGFDAKVEERMMPVWELVANDKAKNTLRSKYSQNYFNNENAGSGAGGFVLKNAGMEYFFQLVTRYIDNGTIPFFNSTGITDRIDIEFDALMTDWNQITNALRKNGLDLIKRQRLMKVIVIREK